MQLLGDSFQFQPRSTVTPCGVYAPNYTIFYCGFGYKVDYHPQSVLFGDLRLTFRTKKIIIFNVEFKKNNILMRKKCTLLGWYAMRVVCCGLITMLLYSGSYRMSTVLAKIFREVPGIFSFTQLVV
jgi:hypothetical protein